MSSTEDKLLADSLRRHLRERVAPGIDAAEREHVISQSILAELAPFGCIGGTLPEEMGGYGLSFRSWGGVVEELGYWWGSLRTIINVTNTFVRLVAKYGTAELRSRFLSPVMTSDKAVCLAFSEPDVGSDIASVKLRADAVDGGYRLNGRKLWITNGLNADYAIVLARTFSQTCDGKPTLFIVDKSECPLPGALVDKMVLRASGTSELIFENSFVPSSYILGAEGEGLRLVLSGLNFGRLNIALGSAGAAQRVLDLSIEYAKARKQFGRSIASFQLVQERIVNMLSKTQAAQALGYRAADALDRGEDARIECSVAKLFATDAAQEVARLGILVHGAMGYATDYPLERMFRDCVGNLIPEGTPDIQTLLIGRELLGVSAIC